MAVLDPLKVVIENYPEGQVEELEAVNNPEDAGAGTRRVPFSRVLYIEREDFREDPPKKFYRLAPGREVRLRYAYLVTCTEVIKDDAARWWSSAVRYDAESRGGSPADGRRVKATLHWVSAAHAVPAEVRLYDHLFSEPFPEEDGRDFLEALNPESLEVRARLPCWSRALRGRARGERVQFERQGYFCVDPDSGPGALVFNRTVTLRDTWAKIEQAGRADA